MWMEKGAWHALPGWSGRLGFGHAGSLLEYARVVLSMRGVMFRLP